MVDFASDTEMFDTMRDKLYASVISDVVDSLGARNQGMRPDVRPIYEGATVVGRAYPVLMADVYKFIDDPYGPEIDAVDSLKPNDVMVVCTQRSTRTCFWGELLATAARARGSRGIVVDGTVRDVAQITKMKFPTFATGIYMVDSAGRSIVIDHNCPVDCGGVLVNPGDIVFGDIDGVVVIPKELEKEVIPLALEKVSKEDQLRDELLKGTLLRDAYNKYGVL
ncbi:MAG: RraA family protein [Dehalococcoidia bacterium]|nr:MAG: RraA family protein [Dehalococcoidia bacterium]